jgi:hypothetical protein
MEQNREIIHYHGYLSYQITGDLINQLSHLSENLNIKKSTYRKIVTLMVEIIENNYKYVDELDNEVLNQTNEKPYFLLKQEGNCFKLSSGNPILREDADKLKNKIEHINQLTYDELKELYKGTMAEGIYENKKGAGLGIMKMAKITKNKINYSLARINDNLLYYTIEISIPSINIIN